MSALDLSRQAKMLQEAVALHQQGVFEAAESRYREILRQDPNQFDACHLLGVLARQRGDFAGAIAQIEAALKIDPMQPAAYCNLGVALQDLGQSHAAAIAFERAIALQPNYVTALNNLGNALCKLNRVDEAAMRYRQAIEYKSDDAQSHYHLGLALQSNGDHPEALACLQRAITLRCNHAQAWCAAGVSLHALQCYQEALDHYDQALHHQPAYAEAQCNRGIALQRMGRLTEALENFDSAVARRPDYARAHQCRGNTLRALSRPADAIEAYNRAGAHGADATQITFLLAALGVGVAPAAAPAAYVRDLFDQYAEHFDRHLIDQLDYTVPALLSAAVVRQLAPGKMLRTLDLGCGTGLCGSYIRAFSETLAGVDLSPNMLDKAASLGLYDDLHCAEAIAFLRSRALQFDVIIAADVLVYFGDLADLFSAVRDALCPGGRFGFSVEVSDGDDVTLGSSNRYAHSLAYLRRLAYQHRFEVTEITQTPVRRDGDVEVNAYLAVLSVASVV